MKPFLSTLQTEQATQLVRVVGGQCGDVTDSFCWSSKADIYASSEKYIVKYRGDTYTEMLQAKLERQQTIN